MQGSSLAAIQEGFQHAIRAVAGVSEALLLVSFSGHAVMSAEGKMMWAPEDADRKDMATHFPMSTLCRDLMEVHVDHVAQAKFHAPAAPNLFVVILADCCREAVTSSQIEPLRSMGGDVDFGPACTPSTLAPLEALPGMQFRTQFRVSIAIAIAHSWSKWWCSFALIKECPPSPTRLLLG